MKFKIWCFIGAWCLVLGICFIFGVTAAKAVVDPLASPNNKFGIHIISASPDEASPAAQLVNSSGGDWGYITVLVESKDRNRDKWQSFFNDLRRRHLIPLVRLATQPEGSNWKLPYEGEEVAWADFLNNLNWPTKNRYVIIYNEPNQGQEWAGQVNARSYARVLDKTITALKIKNPDFFVLNAGFDASAPARSPSYADELSFLKEMNEEVPGIFNRLDGWVSHSYPNPGFTGSPEASGRGTVRTWAWELQILHDLGVSKTLPVFITETGWKHAEGVSFDRSLPSADTVGDYFQNAFQNAWNNSQIVTVTPFLLSYQEAPFDHFSFKKLTGEPQSLKILGASYPNYYGAYQTIVDLLKVLGKPVQENKAELVKGEVYSSIVAGESYLIPLTFKNTGQSIWGEDGPLELRALSGSGELGIAPARLPAQLRIEPGQEVTFNIKLKAPQSGNFKGSLQLFHGYQAFDQTPFEYSSEVKSPVILDIKAALRWKKVFGGQYLLSVTSPLINGSSAVDLDADGRSLPLETRYLLPDYAFNFTLSRRFYQPKTIKVTVHSGKNTVDFGELAPDFLSAFLNPVNLWQLLPFSN